MAAVFVSKDVILLYLGQYRRICIRHTKACIYMRNLLYFYDMDPRVSTPASLEPPVYFLSDAHLGSLKGAGAADQWKRLNRLFDEVREQSRTFVLVGDLFDFWYEWRSVIPKDHFRVLVRLRELVERGVKVHYLAGNHDFRLHGFLEKEIGLTIHPDDFIARVGERLLYIYHGDGILPRDHGYRLLKHILRSPTAQRLFSWIHPDVGMWLAKRASMAGTYDRKGQVDDDAEYVAFAKRKWEEGCQTVILGHSHRPLEVREQDRCFVNLGDWMTHFTYAVHDGDTLTLRKLADGASGVAAP